MSLAWEPKDNLRWEAERRRRERLPLARGLDLAGELLFAACVGLLVFIVLKAIFA